MYRFGKTTKYGIEVWVIFLSNQPIATFMSENGARDYITKKKEYLI